MTFTSKTPLLTGRFLFIILHNTLQNLAKVTHESMRNLRKVSYFFGTTTNRSVFTHFLLASPTIFRNISTSSFSSRMSRLAKNLIVYSTALIIIVVASFIIWKRDHSIIEHYHRWNNTIDSSAMYFTAHEIRIAKKFSDSTLPGLQKKGLIVGYNHNHIETIVAVSGKVWKQRSPFFKESFLTQMMIHNRVKGYPTAIRIVDHKTGMLYAQVTSSEQKKIFE